MSVARVTVAALLVLGPSAATAQSRGTASPTSDQRLATPGAGLEVGAITSVVAIAPAFGGQVSLPVARRVHVEVSGEVAPWILEDGGDAWYAAQLQLRVPLREAAPGRPSILAGVSSFTVVDRWRYDGGRTEVDWDTWLRPHAGVSWQWRRSAHVAVRLDVQGIFIGSSIPFVVPRVAFSTVWRRQRSRV
jgi:hypothetical protein